MFFQSSLPPDSYVLTLTSLLQIFMDITEQVLRSKQRQVQSEQARETVKLSETNSGKAGKSKKCC